MATPTAMKHAASQQGRTPAAATPPVSTPFSSQAHAVFSPLAPRSSPQTVKKSPANSATLMGHSASNSGYPAGPGTGPGSTSAANYDSPAAAAMGAVGLDLGLEHVSISGTHPSGTGRNNDDERGRRLRTVLDMLKTSKGRVSEAGLERLAKSLGLECLWEEAMDKNSKARTLIIAGSALALDIVIEDNIVASVSVTFPESRSIVLRHVERANNILLHDLQLRPGESPLNKSIDRFAANLEKLALLDRLSVDPGLNLYEAVAGIYETLVRLYAWDLQRLRSDPAHSGKSDDVLAVTVQCTRSGRPTMHEHGNLGLGIDYWKQLHLVRTTQPSADAEDRVYSTSSGDDDDDDNKIWTILVGCTPIGDALVYQPVRLSDKWLSDAIEKPGGGLLSSSGLAEPELDWLEPDNTILASDPSDAHKPGDAPTTLAGAKLPDVRFNAVLDPPVVIPLPVAQNILHFLGAVLATESYVTFDSLFFPVSAGTQHDPSEPRTIQCDKDVWPPEDGDAGDAAGAATKKHRRTLFVFKPVYGHVLRELPFSHPSQLVQVLSTLRQYAFVATLFKNGFDAKPVDSRPAPAPAAKTTAAERRRAEAAPHGNGTVQTEGLSTVEDEFAHYMGGGASKLKAKKAKSRTPGEADTTTDRMNIDVVLTVDPVPRLQVMFPFHTKTANVLLEIRQNAQVYVVSQNVLAEDGEGQSGQSGQDAKTGRRLYPQDLGRMLEVCEDIGLWCEWIRSRCTSM